MPTRAPFGISLEGHKCRNRDLVPSHWLRGLLFFHRDSDCSVRREANFWPSTAATKLKSI
jgi:hypothetical protein